MKQLTTNTATAIATDQLTNQLGLILAINQSDIFNFDNQPINRANWIKQSDD